MLLDLKMILGPCPSKRDNQDAQEFLNLIFCSSESPQIIDHAEDVSVVQQKNRDKMALFISLVKALLLHATDTDQLDV